MDIITNIIKREGGYVVDQGGPTNFGVTIPKLAQYRNVTIPSITEEDMQNLTEEEARDFYLWLFDITNISGICNPHLVDLLFDCMVNHGEVTATKWIQEEAGVVDDGIIGPITLRAINSSPKDIYYGLLKYRLRFYAEIAKQEKHKESLRGWVNRSSEFVKYI